VSDVLDALMPVTRLLEELGVPHYVGGSFASSAHGVARASLDVDVVADLAPEQVQAFVSGLQGAYYVDEARVRAAVEFRRSFNLIHLATMFKIDVFMTRGRAFDRESLGRARREAFSADPKAPRVLVASAEDTVLAKLEWAGRTWTSGICGVGLERCASRTCSSARSTKRAARTDNRRHGRLTRRRWRFRRGGDLPHSGSTRTTPIVSLTGLTWGTRSPSTA
jgi:hypothetical protein